MKKKLTIFLIILVTSLCSVFAVEMSYYLISNDSTISLAMDEYRYTDRTFNRVWSSSYKNNTGKFKVTCNAGTEFGFEIADVNEYFQGNRLHQGFSDFIVEYDPTVLTLVSSPSEVDVISPTCVKAKVMNQNALFFKANPISFVHSTEIIIQSIDTYGFFAPKITADVTVFSAFYEKQWKLSSENKIYESQSRVYNSYEAYLISSEGAIEMKEGCSFRLIPDTSVNPLGYRLDAKNNLYIVKYDSAYLTCTGFDYSATNKYKRVYGISENNTERVVVVDATKGIELARNQLDIENDTLTVIEIYPYPFFFDGTKGFKVNCNLIGNKKVEMAREKSTRLYGAKPYTYIISNSNEGIRTRGLTVGDNRVYVEINNMNTVTHTYQYYLEALNYEGCITKTSKIKNENIRSSLFSLNMDLSLNQKAFSCEDYLNGDEVKLRLHVIDQTDDVRYYYDFSYPIDDLEPNFWEVSNITAATNGSVSLGALVDTQVWIDGEISASTTEDRFDKGYIVVYGPDNTRVAYETLSFYTGNNSLTAGTLSNGWSNKKMFDHRSISFTPTTTGTYKVVFYGWNEYGNYNTGKCVGRFTVTK